MKAQEWRQSLGDCVRDFFRTPEMEHFYSVKLTRGAGAYLSFAARPLRSAAAQQLAPGGGRIVRSST